MGVTHRDTVSVTVNTVDPLKVELNQNSSLEIGVLEYTPTSMITALQLQQNTISSQSATIDELIIQINYLSETLNLIMGT